MLKLGTKKNFTLNYLNLLGVKQVTGNNISKMIIIKISLLKQKWHKNLLCKKDSWNNKNYNLKKNM